MMSERLKKKPVTGYSNERILQHLAWEYLEEDRCFEVYGEVNVGERGRLDLVFADSENDLICGAETKRKKRLSDNDISQIASYYLEPSFFNDFFVFFECIDSQKANLWMNSQRLNSAMSRECEDTFYRVGNPEFILCEVKEKDSPPYYDLYIYKSSHLKARKKTSRDRTPDYEVKNEIWYEHKIWKALREKGKLVLPNVTFCDKRGEVDLFARSEQEILALEVKSPRGRITDDQIEKYENYGDYKTEVPVIPAFVVPEEAEEKARKKLEGRNVEIIPFQRFYKRTTTLEDFAPQSEELALKQFEGERKKGG